MMSGHDTKSTVVTPVCHNPDSGPDQLEAFTHHVLFAIVRPMHCSEAQLLCRHRWLWSFFSDIWQRQSDPPHRSTIRPAVMQ